MIKIGTRLKVCDNSGAKVVSCIMLLGGTKKKYASIGDIIKVAVKKADFAGKAKKGKVYFAVVIRVKFNSHIGDGFVSFSDNAVVLLNQNKEMIGTRVFGAVLRQLRFMFAKIISLAPEVV